jgi:SAM-dependent methyltransferase
LPAAGHCDERRHAAQRSPLLADDDVMVPVADYYAEKLATHGSIPQGVDWNSHESQQLRLTQLLRVIDDRDEKDSGYSILDYGCGYGALARRLLACSHRFRYVGFDVCTPMVEEARVAVRDSRCTFTDRDETLERFDYVVASGIFNVRLDTITERWRTHVIATIGHLARLSRKGFAFNMLTLYADADKMHDYLYYADPGEYFRLCKERWSRNVALLHDYDLYEFTMLVRMDRKPSGLVMQAELT